MNPERLLQFNSHWETGSLTPSRYKIKRKCFYKLQKKLQDRFILTIYGLRRTGKSVLQEQLTFAFFAEYPTLSAKHLLRFSFDSPDELDLLPANELEAIFEIYFKRILKEHPQRVNQKVLIALDEIQNIKGWQAVIKRYYDLNPNFKFILTGSSSLYLQEDSESLAGRAIDTKLPCLDFEEFLLLSESPLKPPFLDSLDKLTSTTPYYLTEDLNVAFEHFLLLGGFPDTALMYKERRTSDEILRFIRESIINKVIQKDLRRYFNVKNTAADARLFDLCCAESSNFIELLNVASEVGLSKISIAKHLDIFQQSSLVNFLSKFDRKLRREIKSTRKVYVASPSLMYSMRYITSLNDSIFAGHAAETYAFNKLQEYADQLHAFKGPATQEEVDFYLPHQKLLIECKYSARIDPRNFSYLMRSAQTLKATPLVLTKSDWSVKDLECLPLFLL